jgi:hypothetical protein
MIIAKIKGGLGNQLFIYATAYALAKDNHTQVVIDRVDYDTHYSPRQYILNEFSMEPYKDLMNYRPKQSKFAYYIYRVIRKLKIKTRYQGEYIQEKAEFIYQPIKPAAKNSYIEGYWQSYRYFHHYREELVRQLTPVIAEGEKYKSLLGEIEGSNAVAIHIRRGDYVTFQGGKCLDTAYYFEAIKQLSEQAQQPVKWFVFSDDIPYCKATFVGIENLVFIGEEAELTDIEEFSLMSKCKQFIIANSSFSWWAAYLGQSEDKVVIAPVVDMWPAEFYLPEWTKIVSKLQVLH